MKTPFRIGVAVLLLACLSGCNRFLEIEPDNRAQLSDAGSLAELLTSAYPQAAYVLMAESMSDNDSDKGLFSPDAKVNLVTRDCYLFKDIIQDRDRDSPDFYWAAAYKAIAAANHALQFIEDHGNPAEFMPYKGEALVCRAYAHFMLSVFFARPYEDSGEHPGIPYVTEPEDVVIKKYDRGTVKSTYGKIVADLEEGIPLLDDQMYKNEATRAYHFTPRAAQVFASRVYLFMQNYPKVIEYTEKAFPNGTISTFLRNVIAYKPYPYYVLQSVYTSTSEPCNLLLATTPSQMDEYMSFRHGPDGDFATVFMAGAPPLGGSYAWNIYGQFGFYNIPKYRPYTIRTGANSGTEERYNISILITAEEALFNAAEAAIGLGDYDSARAAFQVYLTNRVIEGPNFYTNLTDQAVIENFRTASDASREFCYMEALLNFKRREFAFEGMRWMDMIRHRIPVHHAQADDPATIVVGPNSPKRILQIPVEAQLSGVALNPR